ncbi:MAG: nicotinate (nicotinamide) nucleotide adenylyltransferase [Chloroherpetonaceae bacterium]|nr:nicotinate (nicotinamide) nucleotide adenylyltransferase [Chloroherpetonaceae bacterium]MDW8019725.1 nicotinate (nicotinamide) nucleotide adenylyltransferase [Chloroherpetonaceae bacterium]
MQTLVLFGGTFDPPHLGHLALLTLTRELICPDKVILSVSRNPLKAGTTATDQQRFEMAQQLAEELNATGNCFEVSDWELKQNSPSYTIETLQHWQAQYPSARWLLAVGEDNYRIFHRWKSPEKILEIAELLVFSRQVQNISRESMQAFANAKVHFIQLDLSISSSELRQRLSDPVQRQQAMRKVPSVIARYIEANKLYSASASVTE